MVQVKGQLDILRSACQEVQGSQDFTALLQAVLALGNHLNQCTHKGNASGDMQLQPLDVLLLAPICAKPMLGTVTTAYTDS